MRKNLVSYADVYGGLTSYPGGEEIAQTFAAMAEFSRYDTLEQLTTGVPTSFPEA